MLTEATTDPEIVGDDGPITPTECVTWLSRKYRRHNELEDWACAQWLAKLCTTLDQERAARIAAEGELAELRKPLTCYSLCDAHKGVQYTLTTHTAWAPGFRPVSSMCPVCNPPSSPTGALNG